MTLDQLIPAAISVSIFLTVFAVGLHAALRDAVFLLRRPGLLLRSILSMNVVMVVFAATAATLFDRNFYLNLRLYGPDDSLKNGTWAPPQVKVAE